MSETDNCAKMLKSTCRMIAETLNVDTVVIIVKRGEDKFMQAGGDQNDAAILVLDGARQVAKELKGLLQKPDKELQP